MAALSNELQIAVEHHQAGRLAEADSLYRRVLEIEPNNADALHLRGVLAYQQARNEDAVGSIEKAIRAGGPHPAVLNDLGKAYFALKQYREAKRCFARALSLDPDHAEALGNFGAVLALTGELREARSRLRRAVALQPRYPNAWFNLGAVLRRLHEPEEAEQSCRRALALDPRMADAHLELGNVLADLGKPEQAEGCYRKAIELDSTLAPAHARLAEMLKMTLRLEEAEASYRAALALQPSAATFQALGGVLYELDRPLEAREAFRRALEVDPELVEARWSLAVLRVIELDDAGRTEDAAAELERLSAWLDSHRIDDPSRAVGAMYPFDLAYRERNHRPLLERYGGLCAGLMERWRKKERLRPARPAGTQPIRVGVVSSHVHEHSVWNAIVKGWVEHMDRGRFELSLFHLGIRQDAETDYARSRAAHFEAGARPLRRWVDAISERRPDVLIYPEIGMDLTSARLACLRLAPLQLAAWGHPLTTGLPTVDAYLSAELFEPPGAGEHYRERLIALPNLGCCYEPYRVEALDLDPAEPGIEPGAPLLLCPGAPFKYAPGHDDV
ncbi:MAG: tetratricopeptide repeat protein, partial [Betaproteobacteria bacterium]